MNAKEYLSQAMHIDQRINSKLEQVTRLRDVYKRQNGNCTRSTSGSMTGACGWIGCWSNRRWRSIWRFRSGRSGGRRN